MSNLAPVSSVRTNRRRKQIYPCYFLAWLLFACAAASQTWEPGLPSATSKAQRPIDTDPEQAAQIGQESLEKFGYETIFNLAVQTGYVQRRDEDHPIKIDYAEVSIAIEGRPFVWVFSRYALSAGVTAQLDSPVPGPADVVALGILVIGLLDAGLLDGSLLSYMTARGRVADTGVEEAMQALMGSAAGDEAARLSRCAALDILMEQAHKAGDSAQKKKIVATQKFYNCRASRSS